VDRLWEKYNSWSIYNYSGDNPLLFIDPAGTEWFDVDGNGSWIYKANTETMMVVRKDDDGNDVIVEQAGVKQLLSFDGTSLNIHTFDGNVLSLALLKF